jgi:hypothetical protein
MGKPGSPAASAWVIVVDMMLGPRRAPHGRDVGLEMFA